jgi:hypothetical protein
MTDAASAPARVLDVRIPGQDRTKLPMKHDARPVEILLVEDSPSDTDLTWPPSRLNQRFPKQY